MTALRPANRKRLEKLATYLESLPEDYQHFGMETYLDAFDGDGSKAEAEYARRNGGVPSCGTSACAVGHGPAAGIYMPPRMISPSRYRTDSFIINWDDYSLLFTGEERTNTDRWEWLFGGAWDDHDGHHWGAAARIRYVLADREIPYGGDADDEHVALYQEFRKS